jgi:hypothetical protein
MDTTNAFPKPADRDVAAGIAGLRIGYGAAYIRRVEVVSALVASLFPIICLAWDVAAGTPPPLARYIAAFLALLVLACLSARFAPSTVLTGFFIIIMYIGFVLTVFLPGSRHMYIGLPEKTYNSISTKSL